MTNQNGQNQNLNTFVKDAKNSFDKAGKQVSHSAETLRKTVAKQLHDTSEQMREQLRNSPIDDKTREQIDHVLHRVEEVRDYLEENGVDDIPAKARSAAQSNVWRSMIVAFVVGAFIGIFLSNRR